MRCHRRVSWLLVFGLAVAFSPGVASCVIPRSPERAARPSRVARAHVHRPPPDDGSVVLHKASSSDGICGDSSFARLELAEAFSWCSRVQPDADMRFVCRAGHEQAHVLISIRQGQPAGGYTVRLRTSGPCWEPPTLGLATVSECGRTLIKRAQSLACEAATRVQASSPAAAAPRS